jgi:hypothetical protein
MSNGTITVEPFVAYIGPTSDLHFAARLAADPMPVPIYLGELEANIDAELKKKFGDAEFYYKRIATSHGGAHGYGVYAGVCIKVA